MNLPQNTSASASNDANRESHSQNPGLCPLCGAGAGKFCESNHRTFFLCAVCDLAFVPTPWHLTVAAQRERYLKHNNSLEDAGYVAHLQPVIDALKREMGHSGRVLDYGCGPAPVLVELLRREGFDAVGYDIFFSPQTPLEPAFDAVVCVETFEHFASPGVEVERIVKCLRPGGILIVKTHFAPPPADFKSWWYTRDQTHVAFSSRTTMGYIASRFGLSVLAADGDRLVMMRRNP